MTDTPKPLSIHDYIDIGLRRKWYIVAPLIVSILVSFAVYKFLPKIYKATTLILVQPQRVPEAYVRPTITASVADRLNTISQEILSRTRLENVIQEFNLYADLRQTAPMEVIIEKMRKAIEVNVQSRPQSDRSQNTFSISFEGEEPRMVMTVTNKLASLFIEENLKVRELQAEGTSEFLGKELLASEEQLKKKDLDIRNFRERNMGLLPQQLDANLRILEGLREQLKRTGDGIRAAEDRSSVIQGQLEILRRVQPRDLLQESQIGMASDEEEMRSGEIPEDPIVVQWNQLKRDLANAKSKYTDSHPDVVDLQRKIASLEPKAKELLKKQEAIAEVRRKELIARREKNSSDGTPYLVTDPATERLIAQYREQHTSSMLEAKRLREEERKLHDQINLYQKRIEDTPKKEQELLLLTRDYDLLKTNYQSLLDKKIQAQMAESLERKQQGEQFKVLDPARLPEKPIRPDRNKILLMGAFIGLVAGLGMAWFRESMDQSFHTVADLEDYLKLKVLAEIPSLKPERVSSAKE